MRFFEIVTQAKVVLSKRPEDPKRAAERRTKVQADIEKARFRTLKAAQVYSDRRRADDDAEREKDVSAVRGHRAWLDAFADRHVVPKLQKPPSARQLGDPNQPSLREGGRPRQCPDRRAVWMRLAEGKCSCW